jgi:hypothetical protein
VVDAAGHVDVTGSFQGTADFNPGQGGYTLTSAGGNDAFVCQFDAAGNFVWARQLGGSGNSECSFGAVDAAGNIYVAGGFYGTVDFDPGPGTAKLTSAGDEDGFVWKLDAAGNFGWARRMGGAATDQ